LEKPGNFCPVFNAFKERGEDGEQGGRGAEEENN